MSRILLPATLDSCVPAMEFLRATLAGQHEDILGFVELAVEELLVNVVRYAYDQPAPQPGSECGGKWGQLEIGCRNVSMDSMPFLCVWIRDWGKPFDPFLEAPNPDTQLDIEDRPIGGLGVHLVKNVSSHHCYSGDDGTNTIELYFKIEPEAR